MTIKYFVADRPFAHLIYSPTQTHTHLLHTERTHTHTRPIPIRPSFTCSRGGGDTRCVRGPRTPAPNWGACSWHMFYWKIPQNNAICSNVVSVWYSCESRMYLSPSDIFISFDKGFVVFLLIFVFFLFFWKGNKIYSYACIYNII